ncbi:hypothetical protein ACH3XW_0035 [Acanthocheilonema viteae]
MRVQVTLETAVTGCTPVPACVAARSIITRRNSLPNLFWRKSLYQNNLDPHSHGHYVCLTHPPLIKQPLGSG